jgi:hypothetical protein
VEVPNPPSTSVAVPRLLAGEALWVRFTQPDAAQLPGLASADASKKVAATEGAK